MNKNIDISNVIITTPRLILRPWRQDDLDDFYEYARVDGVGQMAGWLPHENRAESQRILDAFISGKKTFALEYGGKAVGSLGIEEYDEALLPEFENLACRELGFVLAKDCWGMGLMPEAVREVIRWLFEVEKLDAIFCGHFVRNERSAAVQRKCGFRFCKRGEYRTYYGAVEDNIINVLRSEDWLAQQ